MSLNWRDIPGWFGDDGAATYKVMVARADSDRPIVEIGCWMGRSTGALIEQCREQSKDLHIYCVDTFIGSPDEPEHQETVAKHGGSVLPVFKENMRQIGYPLIHIVKLDSVKASRKFKNNVLEGVFIDGCHATDAVAADIRAWLPKVAPGRYIAGHDYDRESVKQAVRTCIPRQVTEIGDCWLSLK